MRSCVLPTVLALLLLLAGFAVPGVPGVLVVEQPTTTNRAAGRFAPPHGTSAVGIRRITLLSESVGSSNRPPGPSLAAASASSGAATSFGAARTDATRADRSNGAVAMAVLRPMPSTAALLYEGSTPWGRRGEIATAFVRPGPPARYHPPVAGRLVVLHPFEPPPTPYAAGHRGVDLAVTSGQVVLAARGGRVLFAGTVAGRGVVVISHSDGISTEYEPVVRAVHVGDTVHTGQVIGRIVGTHHDCHPGGCLHWGARRGGAYLDPMRLLSPLGPVRLLPWTE
jgi:murein DD-endopeptidase MepM/ murein hydrolase activator NlpD